MTAEAGERDVVVTLRDVFQSQQGIERRLSDSLGEIKLALQGLDSRLTSVDDWNRAADELHREQSKRMDGLDQRVRQLEEAGRVDASAVTAVRLAEEERHASALRTWQVLAAVGGIVGVVATVISLLMIHH